MRVGIAGLDSWPESPGKPEAGRRLNALGVLLGTEHEVS